MNKVLNNGEAIAQLTKLLVSQQITRAVICPGSRNAPLSMAFARNKNMETFVIVDERSAAFYALGMALASKLPVALICTSGTAALNFAPAVAEAFYQHVPLLVITADRPEELLNQGDGQMIDQKNLYANYVRGFFNYPIADGLAATTRYQERMVLEACSKCMRPSKGPVHINVPLREPFYNHSYTSLNECATRMLVEPEQELSSHSIAELSAQWNNSSKVMILVGQHPFSPNLQRALSAVVEQKQAVILCESTSNLHHRLFHESIDRTLHAIPEAEFADYAPDLLITLGDNLISRQIKALITNHPPLHHWHLSEQNDFPDSFRALDACIPFNSAQFFDVINPHIYCLQHENYVNQWAGKEMLGNQRHLEYLEQTVYSDLKVFEQIIETLPAHFDVHLANSSAIRYYQLFTKKQVNACFCNRGTAGIDGSISTAAGTAIVSQRPTVIITGDLSFFYDSNALWNNHYPKNLHIVVINNQGGGIFRYIQGASDQEELDYLFEATHSFSAEHLTKAFQLNYLKAANLEEVQEQLHQLWHTENIPTVLEIVTPRVINGEVLKKYFKK